MWFRIMTCTLFVPTVRGSRLCSICHRDVSLHDPGALYIEPRRLFKNLPTMSKESSELSNTNTMSSLAPSENSAFTPYRSEPVGHSVGTSPSSSSNQREPPPIIRPQPRLAVPFVPQEDRSDSCIYKKIRGKQKERSSSVTELRSPSPDPEEPNEDQSKSSQRSSPVPAKRSNDFKKILQRFQTADKRSQLHRRFTLDNVRLEASSSPTSPPSSPPPQQLTQTSTTVMSPLNQNREVWSPIRTSSHNREAAWSPTRVGSAPRDSWSPANRSSLNSASGSSPVSRNTSARSRLSVSSVQSPLSFLPTRECSPRSGPSPSLVPLRSNPSSSDSPSPLSHTGSTPEPPTGVAKPPAPPLTIRVPAPKRRSLPGRWVKETDIDDPVSLPISPLGSAGYSSDEKLIPGRAVTAKVVSSEREATNPAKGTRYGGSCRRVLSGLDQNSRSNPHGVYVRRSRSRDDKSFNMAGKLLNNNNNNNSMNNINNNHEGSRATLHSIPILMSSESVRSPGRSPLRSPSPPKSRRTDTPEEAYKQYQQMALSHVHTLSVVADRLSDELRRGEEPVSRNRLAQLDFSHFIVSNPHPILTKGKSLFYNAVLPRSGLPDYPVTLMIAPCSQYAPLMRRGESHLFSMPGFLEMEDHDGSIKRFLDETGTPNLDGRNTKIIALPRLNLCSFHSLAAHHLHERMDRTSHEELVSFILLQLLAALKMLQSDGVEALSTNFKEFLLAYRFAPDSQSSMREFPRLLFLPETLGAEIESGGEELVGLCKYALRALCTLLHHRMDGRAPPIQNRSRFSRALLACAELLQEDKSSSLTKAKNVLELALWGSGEPLRTDSETRSWLDLARAECVDTLLKQLVCEPGCRLGPRERFRVEFLLGATPRSIMDSQAAILSANLA